MRVPSVPRACLRRLMDGRINIARAKDWKHRYQRCSWDCRLPYSEPCALPSSIKKSHPSATSLALAIARPPHLARKTARPQSISRSIVQHAWTPSWVMSVAATSALLKQWMSEQARCVWTSMSASMATPAVSHLAAELPVTTRKGHSGARELLDGLHHEDVRIHLGTS
jgi:hypothetical protein